MFIVDSELKRRALAGQAVLIGMAGAGFMGRGIAHQLGRHMPGLRLAAVYSRNVEQGRAACQEAGITGVTVVSSLTEMRQTIAKGGCAVTCEAGWLCEVESVDVLVDATGAVEFGAFFALEAIRNRKPLVLMNAELDGTVGPILKRRADEAGVIISGCDGDQPGVQMNLYRFVRSIGLKPLVCGNIKGLQDRYRNPTTQAEFAKRWGQSAHMVTSFADGTKISFEQAIVANATGMGVARRGMLGYEHAGHVDELTRKFNVAELEACGGIVEYVIGSQPSPGVFVFAARTHEAQAIYLDYGKLGKGPLYSFYVPYHLTVFEVPLSAARLTLFGDVVIAPIAGPRVDVVTTAKMNLEAGMVLDGLGGYHTYGQCEDAGIAHQERLLPMGLAEGCRLTRAVARDEVLRYTDVELPGGRVVERLRVEQDETFFGSVAGAALENRQVRANQADLSKAGTGLTGTALAPHGHSNS